MTIYIALQFYTPAGATALHVETNCFSTRDKCQEYIDAQSDSDEYVIREELLDEFEVNK